MKWLDSEGKVQCSAPPLLLDALVRHGDDMRQVAAATAEDGDSVMWLGYFYGSGMPLASVLARELREVRGGRGG